MFIYTRTVQRAVYKSIPLLRWIFHFRLKFCLYFHSKCENEHFSLPLIQWICVHVYAMEIKYISFVVLPQILLCYIKTEHIHKFKQTKK